MKTFKQIRDFNGTTYLRKNPTNAQTKLGYAIAKIGEGQIATILKEYQKAYQDAWYENVGKVHLNAALTDKTTGAVLLTPKDSEREYQYDRGGLATVISAERAFQTTAEALLAEWDAKEFDITPHYVTDLPSDLTEQDLEIMKGFVIDPAYELPVKKAVAETATVEA